MTISNNRQIQQQELAGKTKLTAVSIYLNPGKAVTRFVMLKHDSKGEAVLPMNIYSNICRDGMKT